MSLLRFKTSAHKNNKHKVQSVVLDHFYENLRGIIDDVDIVYLASEIDEAEKLRSINLLQRKRRSYF